MEEDYHRRASTESHSVTDRPRSQPESSQSPDDMDPNRRARPDQKAHPNNGAHPNYGANSIHSLQQLPPHVRMSDNAYHMHQAVSNGFQAQSMQAHAYAQSMHEFPNGVRHHSPRNFIRNHHVSFGDMDIVENPSPVQEELDPIARVARPKKGAATSAANDLELKKLLRDNQQETLPRIAARIHRADNNGEKSEKHKQVFAMLWLQKYCCKSTASVRRDEVFQRYNRKCGNEDVSPLNPASFGKLVRILFPDVQTRRLGVRGESKYHYVELSLRPEEGDEKEDETTETANIASGLGILNVDRSISSFASVHRQQRSLSMSQLPQVPTDTADFPTPKIRNSRSSIATSPPSSAVSPQPPPTSADCKNVSEPTFTLGTHGMSANTRHALETALPLDSQGQPYLTAKLRFNYESWAAYDLEKNVKLPNVFDFLKQSSLQYDEVSASTLQTTYRTHCTLLIHNFRRCGNHGFWERHTTLPGTMTVPVLKLFTKPELAPWIQECDTRVYQEMVRILWYLLVQEVPPKVIEFLAQIGSILINHLNETLDKMPPHVLAAKIIPASRFVHLLKQWQRAHATAKAATGMLSDSGVRTEMWYGLLRSCDPKNAVEQGQFSPDSQTAAANILRRDVKALLSPIHVVEMEIVERGNPTWTPFFNESTTDTSGCSVEMISESKGEGLPPSFFLERWIQYLRDLAKRFPGHTAHCILNHHLFFWNSIVTEIGLHHPRAFNPWWTLETFLSSMLRWQLEAGGFLDTTPSTQELSVTAGVNDHPRSYSETHNRAESVVNSHTKRKHSSIHADDTDEERPPSRPRTANSTRARQDSTDHLQPQEDSNTVTTNGANQVSADDRIGDPYILPALDAGDMNFISPVKNFRYQRSEQKTSHLGNSNGIGNDSGLGPELSDSIIANEDQFDIHVRGELGFYSSDPQRESSPLPEISQ